MPIRTASPLLALLTYDPVPASDDPDWDCFFFSPTQEDACDWRLATLDHVRADRDADDCDEAGAALPDPALPHPALPDPALPNPCEVGTATALLAGVALLSDHDVTALTAPLPRASAVTPWRKRNAFDVIMLWARSGWRGIGAASKRAKRSDQVGVELARLKIENTSLRLRLSRFLTVS